MKPIRVLAYDPQWPHLFEERRDEIAAILGDLVADIQHIGSTAVPGLPAKPKLDIDAVIRTADLLVPAIEQIGQAGFTAHGDPHGDDRWTFTRDAYDGYGVRLYLCAPGNRAHIDRILFRDWLRSHPDDAARYAALKHRLALEAGGDFDVYTGGKSAFVSDIVRRATESKSAAR